MTTWRAVRTWRAEPPALAAASGRRRKTFGAALEQAEQLARAAEHVGYATKPILLFYALAQAYRAVCAAHLTRDWERSGHGLTVPARGGALLETVIRASPGAKADLYTGAVEAVDERPIEGEVTIRDLWASNFDLLEVSVPGLASDRPLIVRTAHETWEFEFGKSETLLLTLEGLPSFESPEELATVLARYPSLREARPVPFSESAAARSDGYEEATGGVLHRKGVHYPFLLPTVEVDVGIASTDAHTRRFEEVGAYTFESEFSTDRVALPAVGMPPQTIGPLSNWWALLLGLSSLARYAPAQWRQALDVDKDPLAVGLESVLDRAQEVLASYITSGLRPS